MKATSSLCLLSVACVVVACFHANSVIGPEQTRAACAAQGYLLDNGYLDQPADRSKVVLELWDKVNYEKDGVMNWDALLADRRGSYSGRLFGLVSDDADYLVVYHLDESFTCLRVSDNGSSVFKNEANCIPDLNSVLRIKEQVLDCRD
jgi:hypothetical protein